MLVRYLGYHGYTYALLTTTPNEVVKPIHPNRMPVLLSVEEAFEAWLEGTPNEAFALAKPYPADAMHIVRKGEKQDAAGSQSRRISGVP